MNLERLALLLLDDEFGIPDDAYRLLIEMMADSGIEPEWIYEVDSNNGRWFLPAGWDHED